MSATPDGTLADPEDRLIADLQRQLAERRPPNATRRWHQQTATAEVLQVINSGYTAMSPRYSTRL